MYQSVFAKETKDIATNVERLFSLLDGKRTREKAIERYACEEKDIWKD